MRPLSIIIFVAIILLSVPAKSQDTWRFYLATSPSVTVGNRFEGNKKTIGISDLTGYHHIYPLLSILWGTPNPDYSKWQNFARKLNYTIYAEKVLSAQNSVFTGFEIGGRGYRIYSEQSQDLLLMYRNINIPFGYTRSSKTNMFWQLRKHVGFAVNRASSVEKITLKFIDVKADPTYYFTLFAGLELSYLQQKGPFNFSLEYHQGFKNVIDHNYLGYDYVKGTKIYSNGSHFRLNIKWYLGNLFRKGKKVHHADDKEGPNIVRNSLNNRTTLQPVKYETRNKNLKLCFADDQTVDNDSIAIEMNGYLIHEGIAVLKAETCITLELSETHSDMLIFHALNLGRIPPNTYVVRIYDGDKLVPVTLKSDLSKSASLELIYKP